MRYRIEDSKGNIWDTTDGMWRSPLDGRYNSYKSAAIAIAAARKVKNPAFFDARIVEDK
jgi:hypothetical protein